MHDEPSPALGTLVASVAALVRLGYPCDTAHLLPYGRIAAELAVAELDTVEEQPTTAGLIEAAVALTVLYEPALLGLRRLTHIQESARRFGGAKGSPTKPHRLTAFRASSNLEDSLRFREGVCAYADGRRGPA
ncbi:hypothetical protein [Streptomyces sp. NPDC058371]|uniref:hypothetical protein n=1 Tax=Streptomyces sp. NPDC058371 TaxID=3346463 RepID=UPI00364ABA91